MFASGVSIRFAFAAVLLAGAIGWPSASQGQVARVIDSKGTSIVERAGAAPRILGANEKLDERDTISVARDSWAILEFSDGTRITLRPNTVFRIDAYSAGAPESALMGLVKGGFRAVTGLIARHNPSSVRIQTAVATIGIRGTEFDARLCDEDCAQEERLHPLPIRPQAVARVVEMQGIAAAARASEPSRVLVPGAALYEGDGIATGTGSHVVLVFRDGARVTLEQNSRFAIDRFRFQESGRNPGSALLSLMAGNAQVSTGALSKFSPNAFLVRSPAGLIRPHGTRFKVSGCAGSFCASVEGQVSSSGASGTATATTSTGGSVTVSASTEPSGPQSFANIPTGGPVGSLPVPTPNLPTLSDVVSSFEQVKAEAQKVAEFIVQETQIVAGEAVSSGRTVLTNAESVVQERFGSTVVRLQQQAEKGFSLMGKTARAIQDIVQATSQGDLGAAAGAPENLAQGAQNAAVSAAVAALRAATDPIFNEMANLIAQMRSQPPQTAAQDQQFAVALEGLNNRLRSVLLAASSVANEVSRSPEYMAAMGLLASQSLATQAALQSTPPAPPGHNLPLSSGAAYLSLLNDIRTNEYLSQSVSLVGLSSQDLDVLAGWGIYDARSAPFIQGEVGKHLAESGSEALKALASQAEAFAHQIVAEAQRQADAAAAEAERLAKSAADEKRRQEVAAQLEKRRAEQAARAAQQDAARKAEAAAAQFAGRLRTYDITGSTVLVVGPPDFVVPPGILQTLPGEPVVTRVGDRVITTWVENIVNAVNTAHGGTSTGTVTRTEIVGPEGVTTTLVFNIMFVVPMVTGIVPQVGGPLFSLGPDKPGIVQVTHRAPDGTTTVSYPGNATDPTANVAVLEGEVEIVGRGRVHQGEMLAAAGGPLRVGNIPATPVLGLDPNLFSSVEKPVEKGLYVWVRDGEVSLTRDDKSVNVPKGNAAVATRDDVKLLDAVPNFMRFDPTPLPTTLGLGVKMPAAFTLPDGALQNMCTVR